ncbi:glycosyltransferase family 2 protein [Prodigiosinella aquatilis]|nr:glycosyltransferase family 2 protein [Prodigiosinella sp. LS101]WJV54596.1 glycosyltransferase family 2 protein [Prodigiosinella sp. LS101]WJV58958.1 glycosyltransferase family 2 protein [Pectobacteriaceae bacterium C111]
MSNPLLSIAIPTYNFGRFLPDTLNTLLPQAEEYDVNVLVFDGCSTDNTQEIVSQFQERYNNLRYIKAMAKGGIDYDMTLSVSFADSDYCWLFSSDDLCLDGSVDYLLSRIKRYRPDLLLVRHNECDFDMNVLTDWPILNHKNERLYDLNNPQELEQYCGSSKTSEAFFSFMGGLVVNRKTWFDVPLNLDATNKSWAHVTRIFSLTRKSFKLLYCPQVLLNRRGGNDSFSQSGMLERLKLQVNGLQSAVAKSTENPVVMRNLKRVILNEIYPNWYRAVEADLVSQNASAETMSELGCLLQSVKEV